LLAGLQAACVWSGAPRAAFARWQAQASRPPIAAAGGRLTGRISDSETLAMCDHLSKAFFLLTEHSIN